MHVHVRGCTSLERSGKASRRSLCYIDVYVCRCSHVRIVDTDRFDFKVRVRDPAFCEGSGWGETNVHLLMIV